MTPAADDDLLRERFERLARRISRRPQPRALAPAQRPRRRGRSAGACLRALRYFGSFRGEQARPWLLQIVRHSCYAWLAQNRPAELQSLDGDDALPEAAAPSSEEPHAVALRHADRLAINRAITALPIALREVLVLRELEDLPSKDIARIADMPIGTVMSRLSRARALMQQALLPGARPVLREVLRQVNRGAA